ncbi:MAG: hypothetical protein CM1200mP12_19320 [Gammaproteobacteria bacterium]|nr:MAG: hypothetical protein CM1200mP12_19320 [Gammaproteobacteria bacterium]
MTERLLIGFQLMQEIQLTTGNVINENEQNLDWDGDWLSATSISDTGWYAEIFIPWAITSMKSQKGEERTIGFCFYRMMIAENKVSATCKGSPYVNKFLSVFDVMNFKKKRSFTVGLLSLCNLVG